MTLQQHLTISITSILMFFATFLGCLQLLQFWDELLERRFRAPVSRYLQLRMSDALLRESLRWWSLLLMAGTLVLGFVARAYPLAVTFAFLCSAAPPYILAYLIKQREQLLESQLIASSTGLANALKAGLSIPQGLKTVAAEAPAPLRTELQQIVYQFEHGRPLAEALSDTRQRLQLEPFTLFCLALEVAVERGGRVNQAMERLSTSLQEWFRLRRKLDSDTSSGRYAVLIMGLCPAAFIVLFLAAGMDSVLLLFTKFTGQIVLAVIILLICFGVKWASRIMDIRLS